MFRIVVAPDGLRQGAGRLSSAAGKASAIAGDVPSSTPSGVTAEPTCDAALDDMFKTWQRKLQKHGENLETFADNLNVTAAQYSDTEARAKASLTPTRSRRR